MTFDNKTEKKRKKRKRKKGDRGENKRVIKIAIPLHHTTMVKTAFLDERDATRLYAIATVSLFLFFVLFSLSTFRFFRFPFFLLFFI